MDQFKPYIKILNRVIIIGNTKKEPNLMKKAMILRKLKSQVK